MAVKTDSAGAWLATLLAADHSRLVEAIAMAEHDEDDAVHQVRVACRRARSHLRTFAAPLSAPWADAVAKRLQKVSKGCADARDLEVLREYVSEDKTLWHEVAGREQAALRTAARKLARPRTAKAVTALRSAAEDARRLDEEPAAGPAADVLGQLVLAPWEHLGFTADTLRSDSPDADWHRTRVAAKQARYAAEAAAPVLGEDCAWTAVRAKQVQTILGDHQDLVMTADMLEELGGEAARSLAVTHREQRLRVRQEFLGFWDAEPE